MQLTECLGMMQKIEVRRQGERDYYVSSIQELNRNSIYIDVPFLARRALILAEKDLVTVRFISGKSVYEFESRYLAHHPGTIPSYEISVPREIKEGQRRTLFRLDITVDAECWLNMNGTTPNETTPKGTVKDPNSLIRAKTIDISGCGVRISSNAPLKADQNIYLVVKFEDIEHLKVPAKVIWREKVKIQERLIYYAGLRFVDISRKTQDNLVRYLFKVQARRRLFDKMGE